MIRAFVPGDEKAIAMLEKECFSEPWSETALLQSAGHDTFFTVFEENGHIIGYAGMQIVLDEGYVTNIAVTSSARGKGVGTALVQELKRMAKTKALSFISLEVRVSNLGAISLYEKQGFKAVGKRRNFYSHPTEDGLIMTLEGF